MDTHDKQSSHLSIVEAVETLSEIADMDLEHGFGITNRHDIVIGEERLSYRTVYWLNKENPERSLGIVKETFRVILNYLRHFYRDESANDKDEHAIEGIKTIMVLVGEAAKKLDKYTHLFHLTNAKSVMDLKEYKKLQEFYQDRLAYKVDEGKLGQWLLALSKSALTRRRKEKLQGKSVESTKHVFVDLDAVKKDTEYELFFIRKEDGTRFFNPRLLRNMKLVGDFGSYFGEQEQADPLFVVAEWRDKYYQNAARDILSELGSLRDRFFRDAFRFKDNELVQYMGNCLMALMLCANPRNSVKMDPLKPCSSYFEDFQHFLRQALHTREYAKLVAYPPKKNNKVAYTLLSLVHSFCAGVLFQGNGYSEMGADMRRLLESAERQKSAEQKDERRVWRRLEDNYMILNKMLKGHQNAGLRMVLDALQEGNCHSFDPHLQQTLPAQLFYLTYDHRKVLDVRMGCPIVQEYVHKANVNAEFKAFLRSCTKESSLRNILLINLQDRTSWKEHVRCSVLEELQGHPDFQHALGVVTIAKDTDFYHQMAPYDQDNKAEAFISHYADHFGDESSGYYFPDNLKKVLCGEFFTGVVKAIHKLFYSEKNMLLRDHRLDFIEIFDTLLTLKIIESAQPDSFCLLCKDGIDSGAVANAMLFAFLKVVNGEEGLDDNDWHLLNRVLHSPALMIRERLVQQERFGRFVSALKAVEAVKDEHGAKAFKKAFHEAFAPFFKTGILHAQVTPIKVSKS